MQKILIFWSTVFLVSVYSVSAQQISLSLPLLAEKQAKFYYFQGSEIDSVIVDIDRRGKATINIP